MPWCSRVSGPQEAQPRATGALNSRSQVQHRPGAAHPFPRPRRGSAARRPPLRPHRRRAGHSSPQAASHSLGRESGEGGRHRPPQLPAPPHGGGTGRRPGRHAAEQANIGALIYETAVAQHEQRAT
uniref:Uncharacterized protein n=1 Tax=Oryza glumipatula TaxID=40148 RepID=A0A0D9YVC5_9ORYZ